MNVFQIEFYSAQHEEIWNTFLDKVDCPFFFFKRSFLEYHKHLFQDASTLIWEGPNLIGVIPATRKENTIVSHGGLTYGGIILSDTRYSRFQSIFNEVLSFWRKHNIDRFIYKAPPVFFKNQMQNQDLYALWTLNAKIIKRDLTTLVELSSFQYSKGRKSSINKAKKFNLQINSGTQYLDEFHQLLSNTLLAQHNITPTHSLEDLRLLTKLYPEHIQLIVCHYENVIVSGCLIFKFKNVIHSQYLCTSEVGKAVCALDFLIDNILQKEKFDYQYFSFGISTEDGGKKINDGLILQKESFGGKNHCIDTYELGL